MVVSPTDLFPFARVLVHGSDICAKMSLCGPEISLLMHTVCMLLVSIQTHRHV